ncbi:hypothetical protein [Oceanibium sediminis]|uniref:hypothetical protein n=1 Tax=Oceanibium sediminis TaxID=2026339 RepID=UPI000DD435C1|nr:hypothetical protein [Oceanibium sediminis]
MTDPEEEPIAVLSVSAPRRVFSALVQGGLGVLLISLGLSLPEPSLAATGALLIFGLGALYLTYRMYRATARDIILTRQELRDSTGELIAPLEQIASVDKGFFAFKPSNGFLLRLAEPAPRAWVPGVWWRMGTRVGIGGATNGKAARDMADIITILKADPDAGRPPADA